jgi:hypothetical protein
MLDISQQLGNLNGNMNGVLTQLTNHNQRIQALEEKEREKPKSDFKDEIIKLLVKCLLIGATTVATLTGAGSLVSRVLPENAPVTQ